MMKLLFAFGFCLCAFAGGAVAAEIARATTEKQNPYHLVGQLAEAPAPSGWRDPPAD